MGEVGIKTIIVWVMSAPKIIVIGYLLFKLYGSMVVVWHLGHVNKVAGPGVY